MLGKGLESLITPRREREEQKMEKFPFVEPQEEQHIAIAEKFFSDDIRAAKRAKIENAIFHIEIDQILPNPNQPRKNFDERALNELAASIREFGVLQPLVVSKIEQETDGGTRVEYELIAGERRLRASKIAGLRTVPAIVRRMTQPRERLELAVLENIQREDLNSIEMARAFAQLQDEFNFTQREIAVRLGKSREVVANTLRLLNLPSEIQGAIGEGKLNESQARLLLSINNISDQRRLFNDIIKSNLSVREIRSRIKLETDGGLGEQKEKVAASVKVSPEALALKEKLEEFLGTKVDIVTSTGKSGRITINFYSSEEFKNLLQKLFKQMEE
ncbi:MAG: ParB/RepB/Spo0J family partition protein [bacterium]